MCSSSETAAAAAILMASGKGGSALSRLLRQTRISSYDPSVARVYTAPPAHLARGDFGLKRPLPSSWHATPDTPASVPYQGALRYAGVEQMDTAQGMTRWYENEKDPLFRERWLEAGARLSDRSRRDVLGMGAMAGDDDVNASLGPRPRIVYDAATFSSAQSPGMPANVVWGTNHARFRDVPEMLPNYNAMSEREFKKFLERMRRARPQFRAMLASTRRQAAEHAKMEQLARRRGAPVPEAEWNAARSEVRMAPVRLWDEARLPHAPQCAADFLQQRAVRRATAPESDAIASPAYAPPMHPLHGLQYAQPDNVYTFLLGEPVQGRAVQRIEENRRNRYFMGADAGLAVATGGHIGHLPLQYRHGVDMLDYTRSKPARGAARFRVLHAWLDPNAAATAPRRTPPGTAASQPSLGYVRTQLMALRRPYGGNASHQPLPGSPRWIDDPDAGVQAPWSRGGGANEGGSLFGALARNSRSGAGQRHSARRQRLERRAREAPTENKDVQMLDNIKNLLSPERGGSA